MNDLYWFNFVSNEVQLLQLQLDQFDKHAADQVRPIVVQGPFGAGLNTAGGTWRITKPAARRMGFGILNPPEIFAGVSMPLRYRQKVDWVWSTFIYPNDEIKYVLFTHSDIFPTIDFDVESLLSGKALAGPATDMGDRTIVDLTWLVVDVDKCRHHRSLHLANLQSNHIDNKPHWLDMPFNITNHYEQMELGDVAEKAPTFVDAYDLLKWEWCAPCFLHLSKITWVSMDQRLKNSYDKIIDKLGGLVPEKICYRTHTNVTHGTRSNQNKLNCKHRSAKAVGTADCNTCLQGGTKAKLNVYECAILGKCTLEHEVGHPTCEMCTQYEAD